MSAATVTDYTSVAMLFAPRIICDTTLSIPGFLLAWVCYVESTLTRNDCVKWELSFGGRLADRNNNEEYRSYLCQRSLKRSFGDGWCLLACHALTKQELLAKLESARYSQVRDVKSTAEGTAVKATKDDKQVSLRDRRQWSNQ